MAIKNLVKEYLDAIYIKEADELLNQYGLGDEERRAWDISFFERLFSENLCEYLRNSFSEKDWKKIELNRRFL